MKIGVYMSAEVLCWLVDNIEKPVKIQPHRFCVAPMMDQSNYADKSISYDVACALCVHSEKEKL